MPNQKTQGSNGRLLYSTLTSNIVSLGQLDESGCKTVMGDGFLCIFDRSRKLLAKVKRSRNRLYVLDLKLTQPVCLMASLKDDAWLWYARYGHLNFQALRYPGHKKLVEGMLLISQVEQICDGCLVGKQ